MPDALDGLKVLDLSWVVAGPYATKLLAEHGATVVRVESSQRPDIARTYLPFAGGVSGLNRSAFFAAYNNDKYGITLDLGHPKARPVIEKLVCWADVAVENFSPGTLERLNLGYEQLRVLNSTLILLRTSLFGQTGPYRNQTGFGTLMQAQAGFTALVGWPDRAPVGTPTPYTDFVAPWLEVALLMTALEHRRQTGHGVCLDVSQFEAGLHFMAPALLDRSANGRDWPMMGNRDSAYAPHGVFPCLGRDRWCAIAVTSDAQWQGLRTAMDSPAWSASPELDTFAGRKRNEDALEDRLAEWTAAREAESVMSLLQAQGVPAGIVANGKDLHEDPQLAHRGHFVPVPHLEAGAIAVDAPSFRLSETPAKLQHAAPCMGEHTEFVCREILGLTDEEFVDLLAAGVFE